MDLSTVLGYLSGLRFIKPDLDSASLLRTGALAHLLDAALCRVIAKQYGRNKGLWTVAGLLLGIWALGALFLLPGKKRNSVGSHERTVAGAKTGHEHDQAR